MIIGMIIDRKYLTSVINWDTIHTLNKRNTCHVDEY